MDLSNISNDELKAELNRREAERQRVHIHWATPNAEEMAAAKATGMSFYKSPNGLLVDWYDAHPYTVTEHGRYLDWLKRYRAAKTP